MPKLPAFPHDMAFQSQMVPFTLLQQNSMERVAPRSVI